MRPSQFTIPAITGALGLALGLALAPSAQEPDAGGDSGASARKFMGGNTADSRGRAAEADRETAVRTRVRDRREDKKPKEPRISIPLKSVVQILKEKEFDYFSKFDDLHYNMGKALVLLGASEREQQEVMALLKEAKSDILAAEKTHLKLGDVTEDVIHVDMSGMRGPAEGVANQVKAGIRATLPADLAEGLVSAINWEKYYPVDEQSFTRLEITRGPSGRLIARERSGGGGSGSAVDSEFNDDGTPLPADRIFKDRWKSLLHGVTILPKDDE